MPDWVPVNEAAKRMAVSRWRILQLCARDELPRQNTEKSVEISERAVLDAEALLKRHDSRKAKRSAARAV